jgi:hypothetical protein
MSKRWDVNAIRMELNEYNYGPNLFETTLDSLHAQLL